MPRWRRCDFGSGTSNDQPAPRADPRTPLGNAVQTEGKKVNCRWHILDNGEYDTFIFTDPVTGEEFELRDYYVEPTRLKGNSTGPGSPGGDRPLLRFSTSGTLRSTENGSDRMAQMQRKSPLRRLVLQEKMTG